MVAAHAICIGSSIVQKKSSIVCGYQIKQMGLPQALLPSASRMHTISVVSVVDAAAKVCWSFCKATHKHTRTHTHALGPMPLNYLHSLILSAQRIRVLIMFAFTLWPIRQKRIQRNLIDGVRIALLLILCNCVEVSMRQWRSRIPWRHAAGKASQKQTT